MVFSSGKNIVLIIFREKLELLNTAIERCVGLLVNVKMMAAKVTI